jgi:hypothetical protein
MRHPRLLPDGCSCELFFIAFSTVAFARLNLEIPTLSMLDTSTRTEM